LGQAQDLGRRRERAVFFDFPDDHQVNALEHAL